MYELIHENKHTGVCWTVSKHRTLRAAVNAHDRLDRARDVAIYQVAGDGFEKLDWTYIYAQLQREPAQ